MSEVDTVKMKQKELQEFVEKTLETKIGDYTQKAVDEAIKKKGDLLSVEEATKLIDDTKVKISKEASEASVKYVEEFLKSLKLPGPGDMGFAGSKKDEAPFCKMLNAIRRNDLKAIKDLGMIPSEEMLTWGRKDATTYQGEGTAADGGYVVPTLQSTEIINLVFNKGDIMPLCRRIPIPNKSVTIPVITAGTTGYWLSEGASGTRSKATFGQLTLTLNKYVTHVPISDELIRDSNPAIEPIVKELFAVDIGNALNLAMLHGTGASSDPLTGITNLSNIVPQAADQGGVTFNNIFIPIGKVLNNGANNVIILGNPRGTAKLRTIQDSNGQYVWTNATSADPAAIAGYSYKENRNIKTNLGGGDETVLIGGDFSNCYIGDGPGLEIAKGFIANDFLDGVTTYRAVKRIDFEVHSSAQNRLFVVNGIVLV